jgi:hypothetical protein
MSIVSTYPNSQYLVINSTDVTATSWVLANGVISINSQNVCKYNAVKKASVTAAVAETSGVETLTPIAAANSVYQFIIQQYNLSTGVTYTGTYTYTTAASGDTATTICNAFRSQINNDQVLKVTATGAATLILTADAGFPLFTVTILQVGGGLTKATVAPDYVPGVAAVGTTAALALKGITVPAGKSYTTVHLEYSPVTGMNIKDDVNLYSVYDLYLDQADAQTAALVTVITNNINGLDNAGLVANPEAIAII